MPKTFSGSLAPRYHSVNGLFLVGHALGRICRTTARLAMLAETFREVVRWAGNVRRSR